MPTAGAPTHLTSSSLQLNIIKREGEIIMSKPKMVMVLHTEVGAQEAPLHSSEMPLKSYLISFTLILAAMHLKDLIFMSTALIMMEISFMIHSIMISAHCI